MYKARSFGPVFIVAAALSGLSGCAADDSDRPNPHESVPASIDKPLSVVPGDARIVGSTPGDLSFRAPADGMVYLYDATDKTTIDVQRIARGERYEVLPDRSMIKIGQRSVPVTQVKPPQAGREYRIYFSPADKPSSD